MGEIATLLGTPPMPWQQDVLDVLGEFEVVDGQIVPVYDEALITVPRQSGKTTIGLAWAWDRILSWGDNRRVLWTAQDRGTASSKWKGELYAQIKGSDLAPMVSRLALGAGFETMIAKNGGRIDLAASTEDAAHGATIDGAFVDELFADTDERRYQALVPGMAAVPHGQIVAASTAGRHTSTVLIGKMEQGRAAVERGATDGLCYVEYSAPDGWDPDDEDSWWEFMPALGYSITPRRIRQARRTMSDAGFKRAYGNLTDMSGTLVEHWLPPELWLAVQDPRAAVDVDESPAIGVAVSRDQAHAAIAVADADGNVELADYRPGVGWLDDAIPAAVEATRGGRVFFDERGPEGPLMPADVPTGQPMTAAQVVEACGQFFVAVADRTIRVRPNESLSLATDGLEKKDVGDRFVWNRRTSRHDVGPLYAATYAVWGAKQPAVQTRRPVILVAARR